MSFGSAFYEIPIESYAISKISDSLHKNSSIYLIRHWIENSLRKYCGILRYFRFFSL